MFLQVEKMSLQIHIKLCLVISKKTPYITMNCSNQDSEDEYNVYLSEI